LRRPYDLVHDRTRRADELALRANSLVWRMLVDRQGSVSTLGGKLQTLSPLAVLGRGYSITQDAATGEVIRTAAGLRAGQAIVTRFAAGAATSRVDSIERQTNE
jgi:exodeoxyribonuclease VII large subunit